MKRTVKTPGNGHSDILGWVVRVSELGNPWHQCKVSLAVVGDVWEIRKSAREDANDIGLFLWNVRTMDNSRTDDERGRPVSPRGYAATLEAAKEIVECILHNTGTANRVASNPPRPVAGQSQ